MGINTAADAGKECADGKGHDLVIGHVDTGSRSRDVVLTDGLHGAAIFAADEQVHDGNADHHDPEYPREGGQLEDAAHCFTAAGDGKVAEADADDFGKRHGDNGEIVAAQAQRRDADQYAHDARSQAADQQRDQEQPQIRKPFACQRAGYNGGDISADRNKPRMPQGELAHKANYQVQRCDHDDGVAGGGADALNIGGGGAERIGGEQPCQQGKHQRHAHSVQKIGAFYFFTHCSAPSLTLFRRCSCPGYRRA